MKNIKNILKTNEYLIIIILFLVISLLILIFPNLNNSYIKSGKLYISEIMVQNTYTHKDNKICHTNFKLSSSGETLTLSDKSNNIINKITYESMSNDISYGYASRKYTLLNSPSPGKENNGKIKYSKLSNKDIYINEYMSHNQRNSYDEFGNHNDYVEIYNNSNKDIELNNIYLSDDIDNITKYKLPNVTIKKDSYLLIYLGEESKYINNQITANFKLSDSDRYIILSNGKKVIDKVKIVELHDNISYGRKDNNWYYFTKPTPGYANNTLTHESISDIS